MKTVAEFNIDGNKIELQTSGWGNETVLVNDLIKSEVFSFFGSSHDFKIDSDNFDLNTSLKFQKGFGVKIELLKNGIEVDRSSSTKLLETVVSSLFLVYIIFTIAKSLF